MRRWSEQELVYLERKAGSYPLERIARELDRSPNAVAVKARNLGLKLKTELDYLSSRQLGQLIKVSDGVVRYWIGKGYLKAQKSSPYRRATWRIQVRDFLRFWQAYYGRLRSLRDCDCAGLKWLFKEI